MSLDICSALYFIYVSLCSGLLVRKKTTAQQQQQKQKDKQSKKIEKKGFDIWEEWKYFHFKGALKVDRNQAELAYRSRWKKKTIRPSSHYRISRWRMSTCFSCLLLAIGIMKKNILYL